MVICGTCFPHKRWGERGMTKNAHGAMLRTLGTQPRPRLDPDQWARVPIAPITSPSLSRTVTCVTQGSHSCIPQNNG